MTAPELDVSSLPLRGLHLVEASAGCGKTHALRELYTRLLLDRGIPATDILVVTYTRAATAELQTRIRKHLRNLWATESPGERQNRVATALRDFDRAPIFTIHGFCQRVLYEHAFESGTGFQTELLEDIRWLLEEVVADFWTNELRDADVVWLAYLERVARTYPSSLVQLAKWVIQDTSAPVLPKLREPDDSPSVTDEWRKALDVAGRIWRTEHRAIVELLANDPGLHRQTYRRKYVEEILPGALESLFDARMLPATSDDVRKVATGHLRMRSGHAPPKHRFFDACLDLFHADETLRSAFHQKGVQFKARFAEYVRQVIPHRLRARDQQTFDDLLVRLAQALNAPEGGPLASRLSERYSAALIDEFQDTDPVQYGIMRRIYGERDRAVFLIGDPKQAIYSFRGADVFAYLDAAREANQSRSTLSVNWRTDPRLLRSVDAVFKGARNPFVLEELTYTGVSPRPDAADRVTGPPLTFLLVERADATDDARVPKRIPKAWEQLPRWTAAHLSQGLTRQYNDGSPILPSDHGVLCRTNSQAIAMQRALREWGIPSVLDAGSSVFDTEEADELSRTLRAMAFPYDPRAIRSALATDLVGLPASAIDALRHDDATLESWLESFRGWGERWRTDGVLQGFRAFLNEQNAFPRLLAFPDGERRLTNLLHLAELLHVAARKHHLGPMALLRWFGQMRRDTDARAEMASDAVQMRLESDDDAVRLTTIHKSKGLEYPIVYCPFLWDRGPARPRDGDPIWFHNPSDENRRSIDLGSPQWKEHAALAERESFAEAVRLTYVALTRAKHACHVVWGAFTGFEESALAYLLHQGRPPTSESPKDDWSPEAVRPRIKDLTDEEIANELREVATPALIGVEALRSAEGKRWRPVADEPLVGPRRFERRELSTLRTSSFSGLAGEVRSDHDIGLGRDRDEATTILASIDERPGEPVTLADFPAGPGPGRFVHAILEQIDFRNEESTFAVVQGALEEHGVDGNHAPILEAALSEVLHSPLPSGGTLSDVPPSQRVMELEFLLSACGKRAAGAPKDERGITAVALASLLEKHRYPASDPTYPATLAKLGFEPLRGYLRGFVDLVMCQRDAFWIVDYKTNHLGPAGTDYRPDALLGPMRSHHYHLQGLLYSLAVSRYLKARVTPWSDKQWGGVMFLFVRGMHPRHPGRGVSFERPSVDLLHDLDCLFDGGPA